MNDKKQDWEYALENAIYLTLIGYTESSGYTIPCRERERMQENIVNKFKTSLKKHPERNSFTITNN